MGAGRQRLGWAAAARSLSGAAQDLVRAELAALGDDFQRAGRRLSAALLLLCGALFASFWALGLALYLAVELLARWWPRWAAAATVFAAVLALMAVLAALGWRRLQRMDSPAALVQRRWQDHRRWWSGRLAEADWSGEGRSEGPADGPAPAPDGDLEEP